MSASQGDRGPAPRGWFSVPKGAWQCIGAEIDGIAGALAKDVYVALRKLANDRRLPEGPIEVTVNEIAGAASMSYNRALTAIRDLEGIGVIVVSGTRIPGTKARGPSQYSFPSTFPTIRGTPSSTAYSTVAHAGKSCCAESIKEGKESQQLKEGAERPSAWEDDESFEAWQIRELDLERAAEIAREEEMYEVVMAEIENSPPGEIWNWHQNAVSMKTAHDQIRSLRDGTALYPGQKIRAIEERMNRLQQWQEAVDELKPKHEAALNRAKEWFDSLRDHSASTPRPCAGLKDEQRREFRHLAEFLELAKSLAAEF